MKFNQQKLFIEVKKSKIKNILCVPDSGLSTFINLCIADKAINYIPSPKENLALGIFIGLKLAGADNSIIVLQNSGIGNLVNGITSLSIPYNIPVFTIIGFRGGANDSFEHEFMGKLTEKLLRNLKFTCFSYSSVEDFKRAYSVYKKHGINIALLIK